MSRVRRCARGVLAVLAVLVAVLLLPVGAASAHPLGNFTVNTHVGLVVEPDAVLVKVVVDSAEIPTVQAFPDSPPAAGSTAFETYQEQQCGSLADELVLSVAGRDVALRVESTALEFPAGAGGLSTTRLTCDVQAQDVQTVGAQVSLLATPAQDRLGWHEVVAVGDGVTLATSDVPVESISDVLRAYPEDLLQSPLEQTGATLDISAGSGVAQGDGAAEDAASTPAPVGPLGSLTDRFIQLVGSPDLTVGLAILSFFAAVVLGGLHAFAPGHGKALMAAYLVGQDGSWRQAMLIGTSVTVTHTAGVLVLGVVLSTVAVAAPERVYPYLGLASGVLVCGIGITLLRRALRGRHSEEHGADHAEDNPHPHGHPHPWAGQPGHSQTPAAAGQYAGTTVALRPAAHTHTHGGRAHSHSVATDARGLLAVGFAGGLVPAPSAVIVLLGGIALGRAWFGVLLVLAYGIGMSVALAGTGLLLVHARRRVQGRLLSSGTSPRGVRRILTELPLVTAVVVVLVGLGLAARAVVQLF